MTPTTQKETYTIEDIYQSISNNTLGDLLEKGADVNVKNTEGKTVLHLLAQSGDLDSIRKLIGVCSRFISQPKEVIGKTTLILDALDNNLRNPIHYAIENNSHEIVTLLFNVGKARNRITNQPSDFFIPDIQGRDILKFAETKTDKKIFTFLTDQVEFLQKIKASEVEASGAGASGASGAGASGARASGARASGARASGARASGASGAGASGAGASGARASGASGAGASGARASGAGSGIMNQGNDLKRKQMENQDPSEVGIDDQTKQSEGIRMRGDVKVQQLEPAKKEGQPPR